MAEVYGIITPGVVRAFHLLKHLPPQCFVGDRVTHQTSPEFVSDPEAATRARAKRIDVYILCWLAIEIGLLAAASRWRTVIAPALVIIPVLRLVNIVEVTINLNLFDAAAMTGAPAPVASVLRTLTLTVVNFIEVAICFGLVYVYLLLDLQRASNVSDALYFSIVTQFTVGYGDIAPIGLARAVVAVHTIIAFAFSVLVVARVVALLPKIQTVAETQK